MITGRVLNLDRLSVHDGPGIRTTVFLKGCPLRCRWCHNPESARPEPEIGFLLRQCVRCGACVQVCPNDAHRIVDGEHLYDRDLCAQCGLCVEACLPGALELYGRDLPVDEVVAAVLEDRTFYDKSGGGCTVSGGEPLLQAEFVAALGAALRAAGIHVAIDTSGAVAWSRFEAVLPHCDLFLYDLKHTDDARHREHTGCTNQMVLDNLRRLSRVGVPIEIRIPLIPGFNLDDSSLLAAGEFLAGLNHLTGIRLLPYHVARSKYETVGHSDTMPEVPPPTTEELVRAAELLRQAGLTAPVLRPAAESSSR